MKKRKLKSEPKKKYHWVERGKQLFAEAKREETRKARVRVLRVAKMQGHITNAKARQVGRWAQAYYHLAAMVKARQLKKDGFNRWVPR